MDLIYRNDCNLFDSNAGTDDIIDELIGKHNLRWCGGLLIEDDVREFAEDLLLAAQNYIDTAPTITDDEYLAFKCPECHTVYIEDGANLYNSYCPTCGIKREIKYEYSTNG